MSRTIRWGIFGTGVIAAKLASDIAHAPSAALAGVASRDPARARDFAATWGAGASHDSYEALAMDPQIDAIYVATPNALHRDHALLALGAGKPVLCEKPFALNGAQAREIAEAARAADVFCMEAMWTRFLPVITEIRRQTQSGAIGEISLLRASMGFPVDGDPTNRFNDPDLGGGALLDLGVYGVSLAHMLFGAPDRVQAEAIIGPTGVDRQVTMQLGYPDRTAAIAVSHMAELGNRLEVTGTTGRIEVDAPFLQATRARIHGFALAPLGTAAIPVREGAVKTVLKRSGLWPLARTLARRALGRDGQKISMSFPGNGYQFELEEVARCLTAGETESPVMPLDETIAVMETLDRLRNQFGEA